MKAKRLLYFSVVFIIEAFWVFANADVTKTVGTNGADYATLKQAFDDINDGVINTGVITLQLVDNTTEAATAILNASGTGSANYSSVNIYPTITGLTITGTFSGATISLNGADNVTIDGRVGGTGTARSLTITNNSVEAVTNNYTIQFAADAQNNTVKYCNIKGSGTNWSKGIISFENGISGVGNGNNTISNNLITNADDAKRPRYSIRSLGSTTTPNVNNRIIDNEFKDFISPAEASSGLYIDAANRSWTISGNSFYETTIFTSTTANTYKAIEILGGDGYSVTGNYIGGSAALCGGTPWIKTGSTNNPFHGISIKPTIGDANLVSANTIKNFDWTNSANGLFWAISAVNNAGNSGNVNVTNNTIGTQTEPIMLTSVNASLVGVMLASSGDILCENNTIQYLNGANTLGTSATHIQGIAINSTAVNISVNNNVIQYITTSSASTGAGQGLSGIYNMSTGASTITISGNTIAYLSNGTTNTNTATTGAVNGIKSNGAINIINNNTIHDLTIANANTSATAGNPISAILLAGTTYPKTITGNVIYNLSNTYASYAGQVNGIYFTSKPSGNVVSNNFIYGLSVSESSTSATINGIKIVAGGTDYMNNIISLVVNTPTNVYGIFETGAASSTNKLYHNTVYIGGNLDAGVANKSYALYSAVMTNTRDFRNNIFYNSRTTTEGSGLHYAAYFNYADNTGLTLDYNNYYAPNAGGVLGYYNSLDVNSLPLITGNDVSSKNINPTFANAGGTSALSYETASGISLPGTPDVGVGVDYANTTRTAWRMGAYETTYLNTEIYDVESNDFKIITTNSGIVVSLMEKSQIEVYSINGMLIDKITTNGQYVKNLSNGIYVIRVNGVMRKIII